jgi:GntR family transcriptional regulator/MocR family aminotransferase
VIGAFEQLQIAGYLRGKIGAGTWVSDDLFARLHRGLRKPLVAEGTTPSPLDGLVFTQPARPFRYHEPPLDEFPMSVWARIAGRSLRRMSPALLSGCDRGGYVRLRELVAEYLGLSRAVTCTPDRIVIVSGVQQGLDFLARLLLKPGDAVCIEDPGYFGAAIAFRNARARIVPVPVDEEGISVAKGRRLAPRPKLIYVTPSHQFPLGMTMSADRRRALLEWAQEAGAFIVEDDYDSEYRFEGRPVPTLQTLDPNNRVVLAGTFNKLLFPALRLGYIVAPETLMDSLLALRCGVEWQSVGLNQVVLSEFIAEGHLVRHIRRMRDLYGRRLVALQEAVRRYLGGLVETPKVQAGLYTVGLLRNGMSSHQAEAAAAARNIESIGIDRFTLQRTDIQGIMLGFAAFDESRLRRGVAELARALESGGSGQERLSRSVVQNIGC